LPQRRRLRPRTSIGLRRLGGPPPDPYFVTLAYCHSFRQKCISIIERTLLLRKITKYHTLNVLILFFRAFVPRSSIVLYIIEEIRKIFLSRNLSSNMPRNVLISLKNCKNCQTLGRQSRPPCLQRLRALPPDPHIQPSYFVNSSLCICPTKHRLFRNQPKYLIIFL